MKAPQARATWNGLSARGNGGALQVSGKRREKISIRINGKAGEGAERRPG
jgi:hypothetical protein